MTLVLMLGWTAMFFASTWWWTSRVYQRNKASENPLRRVYASQLAATLRVGVVLETVVMLAATVLFWLFPSQWAITVATWVATGLVMRWIWRRAKEITS